MENKENLLSLRLIRVSDEFIAFLYAASVSVFIDKAYDSNLFDYFLLTMCVVIGIFFLAQDWLSRAGGFRRIEDINPTVFYIKAILDVAVVTSLCLIVLDAVNQMKNNFPSEEVSASFYYKISAFAIIAWLWNIFVIFTVVKIDTKISKTDIGSFVLKGHIGNEILSLFPKVESQLKEMKQWLGVSLEAHHASDEKLKNEKDQIKHLWRSSKSFGSYILKHIFTGPLKLIKLTLTSWMGLHLLFLNFVLGLLIFLSIHKLHGYALITIFPVLGSVGWVCIGITLFLLFWGSSILRTMYFAGGEVKPNYETAGYLLFWGFLIMFYSVLDVRWLVGMLAFQQLLANLFIFNFLLIPVRQTVAPNNS